MAAARKSNPSKELKPLDPDQREVGEKRARYLAGLSGVSADEIAGKKTAEVLDVLKWKIDPALLLFRRVCGRVVKRDPVTGELCPVPGATVYVEDTDCSFLGFFPQEPPFFWIHPLHCHREVIATVTTDACGHFCVTLPWWDIDRVLRFRKTRLCFWDVYRPRLRDLPELLPDPPIIRDPRPQPDPSPIRLLTPEALERIRPHMQGEQARRLEAALELRELGAPTEYVERVLDAPIPRTPPPLPAGGGDGGAKEALVEVAERLELGRDARQTLAPESFLGPFVRCRDVWVAEWTPFFDVPDITFRVTQDVDNDGVEETIYSEGFFDVRWNAGSLTVVLEANATAICVPHCDPVEEIPCESEPVIATAGYMTLDNTHHDDTTGYARRPNRPVPAPGDYPPPPSLGSGPANAVSPYGGSLNLHGCHRIGAATHYRLTYALSPSTTPVPFTGLAWWAPRSAASSGPPIHVVPDAQGWYPILPAAQVEHPSWLLFWPTGAYPNGEYDVRLEVGKMTGGSISVLDTSAPRTLVIDNTRPIVSLDEIRWRYASASGPWTNANSTALPVICPVITRDGTKPIRVRVRWHASAQHLRDVHIGFSGCGGGSPVMVDPTPMSPDIEAYRHWHTHAADNFVLQANEWEIPANTKAGCYTVNLRATSRAFNPSGFDFGPALDWLIRQGMWWRRDTRSISIVNT
jgi:hypothetical protein